MTKSGNPLFKKPDTGYPGFRQPPMAAGTLKHPELFPKNPDGPSDDDYPMDHLNEPFPGGGGLLSVRENTRLKELEGVIIKNFKAFYEVGRALREIRDSKLYRETHETWKDYCKDLYDLAERTSYQYIDASSVVDNLKISFQNLRNCAGFESEPSSSPDENSTMAEASTLPLPLNEAQARVLAPLAPDQQVEVWKTALETAPNGRITAAHIKKTARQFTGQAVVNIAKRARAASDNERMHPAFRTAYQAMLDQVSIARDNGWKDTAKPICCRWLVALLKAIASDGRDELSSRIVAETLGEDLLYSGQDSIKLLAAGFTVLRRQDLPPRIMALSDKGGWVKKAQFATQKERDTAWSTRMNDAMTIGG